MSTLVSSSVNHSSSGNASSSANHSSSGNASSPTKRAASGNVSAAKRFRALPDVIIDLTVKTTHCSSCACEISPPTWGNSCVTMDFKWLCSVCADSPEADILYWRFPDRHRAAYDNVLCSDMVFVKVGVHWVLTHKENTCLLCEGPFELRTQRMTKEKAMARTPFLCSDKYNKGDEYLVHAECIPRCYICNDIVYDTENSGEAVGDNYICFDCCLGRCPGCSKHVSFLPREQIKFCASKNAYYCSACFAGG